MKKLFILLLMCMTLIPASGKESQERWHHNKYSMFIHFGLYSELAVCGKANLSLADIVNRYSLLPVSSVTGMAIRHSGSTLLSFMPIPSLPWLKKPECVLSSSQPSTMTDSACSRQQLLTITLTMPLPVNAIS